MMRAFNCLTSCTSSQCLAMTGQVPVSDGLRKELLFWWRGAQGRQNSKMHPLEFFGLQRKGFSSLHELVFQPVVLQVRVHLKFFLFTSQPEARELLEKWVRVSKHDNCSLDQSSPVLDA